MNQTAYQESAARLRGVLFSATSEEDFDVAGSKSCDVRCSVNSEVLFDLLEILVLKQSLVGSDSDPCWCGCGNAMRLFCSGMKTLNHSGELGGDMQWHNTVECIHCPGQITALD